MRLCPEEDGPSEILMLRRAKHPSTFSPHGVTLSAPWGQCLVPLCPCLSLCPNGVRKPNKIYSLPERFDSDHVPRRWYRSSFAQSLLLCPRLVTLPQRPQHLGARLFRPRPPRSALLRNSTSQLSHTMQLHLQLSPNDLCSSGRGSLACCPHHSALLWNSDLRSATHHKYSPICLRHFLHFRR